MNSLNSSSVDDGAETAIARAEREEEAKTGASGAGRTGPGTLAIGIARGLTDGGAVVFGSKGAELLERKNFWEPLADLIGPATASLLVTF